MLGERLRYDPGRALGERVRYDPGERWASGSDTTPGERWASGSDTTLASAQLTDSTLVMPPDTLPTGVSPLRQPLSGDEDRGRALLQDCDVKKALDTISQTFFAGDPEVIANRYIVVFDHPALGPSKVVGSTVTFGQAEVGTRLPVPELGEHTEEVLLEVGGYSWDEVTELKDLEVI